LARWTERGLPLTANIARLSESRGMLRARLRLLRVTMRAVGNHRGARTISFALVAGLAAFEAVLLFGTGAIGIPGVLLVRSADQGGGGAGMPSAAAFVGGESFIAKAPVPAEPAKPTPVEFAAALASTAPTGEARLDGLGDIPLKPWVSEKPKADAVKPEEANRPLEASSSDALPWDAVEPYRPSSDGAASAAADVTAALPARALETPNPPPTPVALPKPSAVESWVKAKAIEIKGEDRGRSLFHFEFWLDAPNDVKQRLVAVAYEFNTPAVMPQAQVSSEAKTGFRVSAGGLTCADKVTVTLKFKDGQSEQVAVDGCRLVS